MGEEREEQLSNELAVELKAIAQRVRQIAQERQQDSLSLLALLRLLEGLHREIRDEMFQESLPNSRHELYALLRDMEAEGGWPYVHRMKLRSLLANLVVEEESEAGEPSGGSSALQTEAKGDFQH